MKFLFVFLTIICTLYCKGEDNHGTMFYNADGTQNAYFIEKLHIDSIVVVMSEKNGHLFAIRNTSPKSLKGKVWNSSNVYLYNNTDYFWGWILKDMPITAIPNEILGTCLNGGVTIEFSPPSKSMSYQIVSNLQTPRYYWLIHIRGDAYNFLTVRNVWDSGRKEIKFKDEKAYYKLLIPVWDD